MSWSIDSTKVRIPMSRVEVVNPSLLAHWILVNEGTGEVKEDEYKGRAYSTNDQGIHIRWCIEKIQTNFKGKSQEDYLTILIHSKTLKGQYLQGMRSDNIHQVHEYLQAQEVASFSLDALLSAHCTDTDFKKDCTLPMEKGKQLVESLVQRTIPVKEGRGATPFRKANNRGIQWSERQTQRYKTNPYYKIYSKQLDMESKSSDFKQAHMKGQSVQDIWRSEYTIKNKAHFKAHGVTNTTLGSLLDLPQEKMQEMASKALRVHIEPAIRTNKSEGLKPSESVLVGFMQMGLDSEYTLNQMLSATLDAIEGANKTKWRAKIQALWKQEFEGTDQGKRADDLDSIYLQIGIDF